MIYINSGSILIIMNVQTQLLNAMQQQGFYPHSVSEIQRIEMHISTLFLTGRFAYKLKNPVNFGFLDFSTLDNAYLPIKKGAEIINLSAFFYWMHFRIT